MMRIQNSLRNMIFGLTGQIISSVMGFIVRTVFIYMLGVQYLGVEGLFSSILTMLSLANLGFDTAMTYSLYKPLAENDQNKIQALLNLYKKAYRIIGLFVFLIGMGLLPFLPMLMNGDTSIPNIQIIYLMFLLNSVSSYYFAYKQSIIVADQHNHVVSKIHSICTIISNSAQILMLFLTKYYIAVLAVQLVFRFLENVYVSRKADQLYPFLKHGSSAKLSREDKKNFMENLYAQSLYKISAVVITGTDNVVISLFVGITSVGIYSNYLLIIGTLSTFISYLFYSIVASVGNVVVQETIEKKYFIFQVLNFVSFWVFGFSAVALWTMLNPFIGVWLGTEYVFNKYIVFAIVLNFFTGGMQNAPTTFRETTGLFKKGKYRPLVAALINLVVSILLARQVGIAGVLFGTVVSRACTYFWYDPYVIHKYVFQQPVKKYFVRYTVLTLMVTGAAFITDFLGGLMSGNPLAQLAFRGVLCIAVPNLIIVFMFRKSDEFQFLLKIGKQLAHKLPLRLFPKKSYNL